MKLILIGAPGSGKSAVAKSLAEQLPGTTTVVDGYVDALSVETEETYGIFANYGMNLQAAVTRLTAEKVARTKNTENTIVCGSSIESLVYNGLRLNRDLFWNKDDEEVQKTIITIGEGASMGLGVIVASTVDTQELMMFLPLSEDQREKLGKSYEVALDKMLPEAIQSLKRPYVTLDGDNAKKVQDALKITEEYRDYLSQREAQEPTVVDGQSTDES